MSLHSAIPVRTQDTQDSGNAIKRYSITVLKKSTVFKQLLTFNDLSFSIISLLTKSSKVLSQNLLNYKGSKYSRQFEWEVLVAWKRRSHIEDQLYSFS